MVITVPDMPVLSADSPLASSRAFFIRPAAISPPGIASKLRFIDIPPLPGGGCTASGPELTSIAAPSFTEIFPGFSTLSVLVSSTLSFCGGFSWPEEKERMPLS
jgi:hypothetical protein